MTNYKIIADKNELEKFVEFLPDGDYYVTLMARDKDNKDLPPIKDGQISGTKRICKKSKIVATLYSYEIPYGMYTRKGCEIHDHHLSPYITLNARNMQRAFKGMTIESVRLMSEGVSMDPSELSMKFIHKYGEKTFFDFDFDVPVDRTRFVEFGEYTILETKGGMHLIIKSEKIGPNQALFRELLTLADQSGSHGMIPVPGCYQRGFTPRMTHYVFNC